MEPKKPVAEKPPPLVPSVSIMPKSEAMLSSPFTKNMIAPLKSTSEVDISYISKNQIQNAGPHFQASSPHITQTTSSTQRVMSQKVLSKVSGNIDKPVLTTSKVTQMSQVIYLSIFNAGHTR